MKTDRPAFAFGRRFAVVLLIAVLIAGLGFCRKTEDIDATEMVLAGETPLAKAAAHGDIKAIGKLIDDGAEVDTKDTLGRTPLHIAAFYGNSRTSAFLISKGADVNAQDRIGMTPLHVAVISGGIREVEALLEEKADINLRTAANQTVLHLSAATGQPRLTRLLLDRGADPNSEDGKGKNPLFYAVQNSHPQTAAVIRQAISGDTKKAVKRKAEKERAEKTDMQKSDAPSVPSASTVLPESSAASPENPVDSEIPEPSIVLPQLSNPPTLAPDTSE